MAIPGMEEASWAHRKKIIENSPEKSPDFHFAEVPDPVEVLIEKVGLEDAIDEIADTLKKNPDDPEARRQATLVVRIYDEKVKPLRNKLDH